MKRPICIWLNLAVFSVLVAVCSFAQTSSSMSSTSSDGNVKSINQGKPMAAAAVLPDAPSVARLTQEQTAPVPASRRPQRRSDSVPVGGAHGSRMGDAKVLDWPYLTLTGAMVASSVVNAEYAQKCIDQNSCTSIPDAFRSRGAMYGAGLPADAAVAYFAAYLKRKGKRWWFIPEAVVTAGNIYVAHHWATRLR